MKIIKFSYIVCNKNFRLSFNKDLTVNKYIQNLMIMIPEKKRKMLSQNSKDQTDNLFQF